VTVYRYCTVINGGIYFIVALRQSDLQQFQAVILEDIPLVLTVTRALKKSENFIKLKFYASKIYIYIEPQRICEFQMNIRTKRKYFPIKQEYTFSIDYDGKL